MNLFETVRFALRGVTANKLRSGLTVLGLLIGVAAVILLIAVGNGAAQAVQARIARLGTTTLTVSSTNRQAAGTAIQNTSLTLGLADALRDPDSAPDVKSVSPVVSNCDALCTRNGAVPVTCSRWVRMAVTSSCAAGTASELLASTTIWFTGPYPVNACCTALIGAPATSFGSVKPAPSLGPSTPTTVNSVPLTVICWLSGSTSPNRSSATVCPITSTRRPSVTSWSVNADPRAIE